MPRPKEFNPDEALEKAMQAFWHKGYEATSMEDLLSAMNLNRGSLYGTFGDKRQLFLKVVDRYYMTYNDYGHLQKDPKVVALTEQIGPKSVITRPGAGQQLSGPGFYEITGLAWSGGGAVRKVEVSTDGGRSWKDAEFRTPAYPMAHTRFGLHWNWDGKECELQSRCTDELGTVQPTRQIGQPLL